MTTLDTFYYAALAGFDRSIDALLLFGFLAMGIGSAGYFWAASRIEKACKGWSR